MSQDPIKNTFEERAAAQILSLQYQVKALREALQRVAPDDATLSDDNFPEANS